MLFLTSHPIRLLLFSSPLLFSCPLFFSSPLSFMRSPPLCTLSSTPRTKLPRPSLRPAPNPRTCRHTVRATMSSVRPEQLKRHAPFPERWTQLQAKFPRQPGERTAMSVIYCSIHVCFGGGSFALCCGQSVFGAIIVSLTLLLALVVIRYLSLRSFLLFASSPLIIVLSLFLFYSLDTIPSAPSHHLLHPPFSHLFMFILLFSLVHFFRSVLHAPSSSAVIGPSSCTTVSCSDLAVRAQAGADCVGSRRV